MANTTTSVATKVKFTEAIATKQYRELIARTIENIPRQQQFVCGITSVVANSPALMECNNRSIITAALMGESLKLSPAPMLGQFYMVPFKKKEKKDRNGKIISPATTEATFVLGYKGMIQLAIRSGQYRNIIALEMKQGEVKSYDPLTETVTAECIQDPEAREKAPTTGYFAAIELNNGFKKSMYWTKQKMLRHADKYSKAFSADVYERIQRGEVPENEMWKYSSFWYTDFDGMAKKTMLRQIISHWGIMDTSMEKAITADNATINDDIVPAEYYDAEDPYDPYITEPQENCDQPQESETPAKDKVESENKDKPVDFSMFG